MVGCAKTPQLAETDPPPEEVGEPLEKEPALDRTQETVYNVVNGAAVRFDSFFGSADMDTDARVSRGRVSLGHQWDPRNGSKTRFRLKARFDLRALQERTQLILGRGDADELIDGTGSDNIDNLPGRFNDFEDDDWLIGLGFSRDQQFRRGWNFSVGVKLTTPLEPFVRTTYRWLLRTWTILQGEDEIAGMGWTQKFTAYQSISDKNAMSYALYATGQTQAEVPLRDYGIELRYRKRIARKWLFVEFLTYLSWPREFLLEERKDNLGFGIEFEMQFGDWPGRPQT